MSQVQSANKGPNVVRPEIVCPMRSESKQAEMPGFGAEKGLLLGHARTGSSCSRDLNSPREVRVKATFEGRAAGCTTFF